MQVIDIKILHLMYRNTGTRHRMPFLVPPVARESWNRGFWLPGWESIAFTTEPHGYFYNSMLHKSLVMISLFRSVILLPKMSGLWCCHHTVVGHFTKFIFKTHSMISLCHRGWNIISVCVQNDTETAALVTTVAASGGSRCEADESSAGKTALYQYWHASQHCRRWWESVRRCALGLATFTGWSQWTAAAARLSSAARISWLSNETTETARSVRDSSDCGWHNSIRI